MLQPEDEDRKEPDCANVSWIDVVYNWYWQDCNTAGHMSGVSSYVSTCNELLGRLCFFHAG
jgi:hypothetical protein